MIRRPPSPPLFPYTTLFRSVQALGGANNHAVVMPDANIEFAAAQVASGDRKSTRLNSSHVAISYAVFCLKKKNKVFGALNSAESSIYDAEREPTIDPARATR